MLRIQAGAAAARNKKDGASAAFKFTSAIKKVRRNSLGVMSGVHGMVRAAQEAQTEQQKAQRALRSIVIYIVFMVFYSLATAGGLFSSSRFYLTEAIKGQYADVEMKENYAPTFPKAFMDIATVEEWYHWLDSAFSHASFAPNTFDGSTRHGAAAGDRLAFRAGSTLGFDKFVGAIRLGQLRARGHECGASQVPVELSWATEGVKHNYHCSGDRDNGGQWSLAWEDTAAFGSYDPPGAAGGGGVAFPFDGIDGWSGTPVATGTVNASRSKAGQQFSSTKYGTVYDVPSHTVLFDPAGDLQNNALIVQKLTQSGYVDMHTRALIVEATMYNPAVDHLVLARLMVELPPTGGALPTWHSNTLRLYNMYTEDDTRNMIYWIIVAAFYFYYFVCETVKFMAVGVKRYFSSLGNCSMVINILFFVLQMVFLYLSYKRLPAGTVDLDDGSTFVDFRPAASAAVISTQLGAFNTFLNWAKTIGYLSYAPTFALLTDTLRLAAGSLFGFSFVFFIVFFGFAQAHTMVFAYRVAGYRTITDSMYTLMLSLLGDFDFEELRDASPFVGPFMFTLFTSIAVFVILNMIIAIISDAYSESRDAMMAKDSVNIVDELVIYVRDTVEGLPIIGPMIKKSRLKAIQLAKEAAARAEAAALAAAKGVPAPTGKLRGLGARSPSGLFSKKNKKASGTVVDADGDGKADEIAVDHDGNGEVDTVLRVSNSIKLPKLKPRKDGPAAISSVAGREIDANGDGQADFVAIADADSSTGATVMKVNTKGFRKRADSNDTMEAHIIASGDSEQSALVAIDTSGNHDADTILRVQKRSEAKLSQSELAKGQALDLDGDGIPDMVAVDTTGDGHLDTAVELDSAIDKISAAVNSAPEPIVPRGNVVAQLVTESVCMRMKAIPMTAGTVANTQKYFDAVLSYARETLSLPGAPIANSNANANSNTADDQVKVTSI